MGIYYHKWKSSAGHETVKPCEAYSLTLNNVAPQSFHYSAQVIRQISLQKIPYQRVELDDPTGFVEGKGTRYQSGI